MSHLLTHPVLEVEPDTAWTYWKDIVEDTYPSFKLLGPNMVVFRENPAWGAEPEDMDQFLP